MQKSKKNCLLNQQVLLEKSEPPPPLPIKEKEQKTEIPQQKKQTKGKKSPELEFVPHRKNCPNENINFTQLRELFPDVTDTLIWDLFVKCRGDPNWCAELLGDENKSNESMKGDNLSCDCASSSSSGSSLVQEVTMSPRVVQKVNFAINLFKT